MPQNQNERRFCARCMRNVFPTRPKPNLLMLILFFPIYIIIYGFFKKDKCPICYSETQMIDYNYPPFSGTPDSYDPNLIASGTVIRTEGTIIDPEGDFVKFIPDNLDEIDRLKNSNDKEEKFCPFCGNPIQIASNFCPKCGGSL